MGWHFEGSDNKWSFVVGFISGATHILLNIKLDWGNVIPAAITAAICGFCGIAGKELFKLLKRLYIKYKKNRKIS